MVTTRAARYVRTVERDTTHVRYHLGGCDVELVLRNRWAHLMVGSGVPALRYCPSRTVMSTTDVREGRRAFRMLVRALLLARGTRRHAAAQ